MKANRLGFGWLLCGAALALRTGWVLYCWTTEGPQLKYPDEELHWQLATNLARHETLISNDGRLAPRMPAYPLLLTLFAPLGSGGILAVRLAQAGLGAITTLVVYRLADSTGGRRAALVAGLLVCCDPFAIFLTNLLLTEVLFTLLGVGLTACAWQLIAHRQAHLGYLAGMLVLGPLAILTRPSAAGWVPLAWLLVWCLAVDRPRVSRELLLAPVALAAMMLPWGLRNKAALGRFAWLSTNGGVTLYDAQGPQADGSSNQAFLQEMPELRDLDEVTIDQTLKRLAIKQMREDPVNVLRLAGRKLLRTWSPLPHVEEHRTGLPAYASAAYTVLVLVGSSLGLAIALLKPARGRPGQRAFQALIWLPVAYFTLVHCVYIGSVRYRVPLTPFLCLSMAALFGRTGSAAGERTPERRNEKVELLGEGGFGSGS